jgi:uncharacterized protein (DUF58 family)
VNREELHARVRRLLFASPALAKAFARGDFRSVFRGRGIEFDSLREYSPDDDLRLLDHRATVRLGRPFVRTYREDRSLTLFLLIDVSASMEEGSGELSKLDTAVLTSSLLAYAAQFRSLPVGCLLFGEDVLGFLPPQRGKAHALAVADSAALAAESAGPRPGRGIAPGTDPARGTELGGALGSAAMILKRRSLVIILSEFRAKGWERKLGELAADHDVVAVHISDPLDEELPERGSFDLVDPESGEAAWFPLCSPSFRRRWKEGGRARRATLASACSASRVPVLEIGTGDDPSLRLLDFFDRRRRRC